MSTTAFTALSPLAVKLWARKAFSDAVKNTLYGKMTGKSDRSIVQVKDELKGEGDRARFRLRCLPTGTGVQDDETLEGNEEGLDYRYFDVSLGEKRHAIKVDLNLSAQRTMADVRQDAKDALQEWIEEYLDTTYFEYLSGIGQGATTAISKYHVSGALGGNALQAPSSDRIVFGGTGVTTRAGLAATDIMTLTVLDKVAEKITRASPTMRKPVIDGQKLWPIILSPEQVTSIRTNTSSGQWLDIQKAAMMGGKVGDNPIWSDALGVYNDFLLMKSVRIPTFADGGAAGTSRAPAPSCSAPRRLSSPTARTRTIRAGSSSPRRSSTTASATASLRPSSGAWRSRGSTASRISPSSPSKPRPRRPPNREGGGLRSASPFAGPTRQIA
jgi:N4-gp56 family major capsid protein